MKFTWFNVMPWPYLPDDFREKNRSVWVDIPNTLYDPRKGHFVYHHQERERVLVMDVLAAIAADRIRLPAD